MSVRSEDPDGRSEPVPALHEERHSRRSSWVGTGSLACPMCDAPTPLLSSPVGPAALIGCPYCDHTGVVSEFLSMQPPARAPRVNVYARLRV